MGVDELLREASDFLRINRRMYEHEAVRTDPGNVELVEQAKTLYKELSATGNASLKLGDSSRIVEITDKCELLDTIARGERHFKVVEEDEKHKPKVTPVIIGEHGINYVLAMRMKDCIRYGAEDKKDVRVEGIFDVLHVCHQYPEAARWQYDYARERTLKMLENPQGYEDDGHYLKTVWNGFEINEKAKKIAAAIDILKDKPGNTTSIIMYREGKDMGENIPFFEGTGLELFFDSKKPALDEQIRQSAEIIMKEILQPRIHIH